MTTTQLLQPDWPVPTHVRSACSLRNGGVSQSPYDSLNLGDHVGDDAVAVARNRETYAQALQAKPVYLKQVHGFDVATLDAATVDGTVADACITTEKGLACTIMVADCLPVLFCNRAGTVVGAAHAGWRGLCGAGGIGVLEQIFKRFEQIAGKNAARGATEFIADDVLVWLGPCIGPTAFEVGAEVREAFLAADSQAATCFKSHREKFLTDLPALARQRLAKLGITQMYGNDGGLEWCTVSNPSKFFSHRRDKLSGRFAASIWLT
ncbi:MAG: peptidoglycan editing factor PgeF [Burkholderiales bacterium]|nr:MAG: peptidoglycan editing factor PgeF [Burkholderiales bacterium]